MTTDVHTTSYAAHASSRSRAAHVGIGSNLAAGALVGLLGGLIMALWSMSYSAFSGLGFLLPMKLVAGTVYGVETLVGGSVAVLTGVVLHALTSAGYGMLFALLLPKGTTGGKALLAGLLYGLGLLALMTFVVLPMVNEVMRERVELITFSWVVTHLIYGATLSLVPSVRRKMAR